MKQQATCVRRPFPPAPRRPSRPFQGLVSAVVSVSRYRVIFASRTKPPISAFRPRRWKGAILPDRSRVTFRVIEADKRPISAVADQRELRHDRQPVLAGCILQRKNQCQGDIGRGVEMESKDQVIEVQPSPEGQLQEQGKSR